KAVPRAGGAFDPAEGAHPESFGACVGEEMLKAVLGQHGEHLGIPPGVADMASQVGCCHQAVSPSGRWAVSSSSTAEAPLASGLEGLLRGWSLSAASCMRLPTAANSAPAACFEALA